ncbi:phosphatase PAP2 family protein [Rathayibacter tritici]|uniref:phosphatase PAP2 family protein n=1 Tax=Rathayibacter tritici TaxID=33888 RepID=UPI000ADD9150|nr:phosphatase PAP2 family protein [Rathayibacter tritici]
MDSRRDHVSTEPATARPDAVQRERMREQVPSDDVVARLLTKEAAHRVSRRWPLISASLALLLTVLLAVLIAFRPTSAFRFDVEWMNEIVEHRSPAWDIPALVMNTVGAGLVGTTLIPLGIVTVLLVFRRRWAALYYAIAALVSVGATQLVKELVGRARPADMLVTSDYGSFPSGHTANAATTAMVLALVFPLLWVWIAGFLSTVAMMASRTYLGAHWLSDTVGGLLLGIGVALVVWAPLAGRLRSEAELPHPPIWIRRAS